MWVMQLLSKEKFDSRIYEVGTIIKLVVGMNIPAVCDVATSIKKHYELEDVDEISNECIYDAYCTYCEGEI